MSIKQIPIRAKIEVAGATVETPYVLSFNVHRRRGSPATFDASVKVKGGLSGVGSAGGGIVISAGSGGVSKIFTGIVRAAKITPCWDDPSYVNVTLSGDDTLSLLKGKKYSRRCRGTKATFCIITDVTRSGLKSGKFATLTGASFELEPGKMNTEMAQTSQGINSSIKGLKVTETGGADQGNNLGAKLEITLVDNKEK
jgi:hypothetical protein